MRRLAIPGGLVAAIVLLALFAPFLGLPDPVRQDVANRLAAPGDAGLLGRDDLHLTAADAVSQPFR